jgi:hypothetical protein
LVPARWHVFVVGRGSHPVSMIVGSACAAHNVRALSSRAASARRFRQPNFRGRQSPVVAVVRIGLIPPLAPQSTYRDCLARGVRARGCRDQMEPLIKKDAAQGAVRQDKKKPAAHKEVAGAGSGQDQTRLMSVRDKSATGEGRRRNLRYDRPPVSTVTARRFCDQQEMSLQVATGRSLP